MIIHKKKNLPASGGYMVLRTTARGYKMEKRTVRQTVHNG